MIKKIKEVGVGDTVVPSEPVLVRTGNEGYPWNLGEAEVIRLIYFFGSRKCIAKAVPKGFQEFGATEQDGLREFLGWFGLVPAEWTQENMKKSYLIMALRFRSILEFLKRRPAFITKDIYKALKVGGYENVAKVVVFVVNQHNQIVPRLAVTSPETKRITPIGNLDQALWNIQNHALDKVMLLMESITPRDIKTATLGAKSKAIRDIFAMYHMSRLNNKNPNQTLVNIQVNQAAPSEKVKAIAAYVAKNRES